jgi:hypothetical protein
VGRVHRHVFINNEKIRLVQNRDFRGFLLISGLKEICTGPLQ